MKKSSLILLIFGIVFLLTCFAFAQETSNPNITIKDGVNTNALDESGNVDTGVYTGMFDSGDPKTYLLNELMKSIKTNPVIKFIDSAFVQLNSIGIFFALLGVSWESMSVKSFAIVISLILWIVLLFYFRKQLENFFNLNPIYCYLISVFSVLILAHSKALMIISDNIISLIISSSKRVSIGIELILIIAGFVALDIWSASIARKREDGKLKSKMKKIDTGARIASAIGAGVMKGDSE